MSIIYSDLHSWQKASKAKREESLKNLPDHIQSNYTFKEFAGTYNLAVFTYNETGDEFILIPGGECPVGFTIDDIFLVLQALKSPERKQALEEAYPSELSQSRPARTIQFQPFLVSKEAICSESREGSKEQFKQNNWRLLSEAEWEYLAREGGNNIWTSVKVPKNTLTPTSRNKLELLEENGFGIVELHEETIVADSWHDDYKDALTNQLPWIDENAEKYVSRIGHTSWQDDTELIALHAAYRMETSASKEGLQFAVVDIVENYNTQNNKSACSLEHIKKAIKSKKNPQIKLAQMALQEAWGSSAFDLEEVSAVYELVVSQLNGDDKLLDGWIQVLINMICYKTDLFFNDGAFNDIYTKHVSSFIPLLIHEKKKIRQKASLLVIDFSNKADTISAFSELIEDEKDNTLKASLVLGLAYLTDSDDHNTISLLEGLLGHNNYIIKGCAALSLYKLKQRTDEVFEPFLEVVYSYEDYEVPWFGGDMREACLKALKPDEDENIEDVLKSLIKLSQKNDESYQQIMPIVYQLALSDDMFYNDAYEAIINSLEGKDINTAQLPWAENRISGGKLLSTLANSNIKNPVQCIIKLLNSDSLQIPKDGLFTWGLDLIGFKKYGWDDKESKMVFDHRNLSKEQREVCRAIAENFGEQNLFDDLDEKERRFELDIANHRMIPNKHTAFRRWIGLDEPSILEKSFQFEEGTETKPLYVWANERWAQKPHDRHWDVLKKAMTNDELIEASILLDTSQYSMLLHWDDLFEKVQKEIPHEQILKKVNQMLDSKITDEYSLQKEDYNLWGIYFHLHPIGNELREDAVKIMSKHFAKHRFYCDYSIATYIHFPEYLKPYIQEQLTDLEQDEDKNEFNKTIEYLSKVTDPEIAEQFIKTTLSAQSQFIKFGYYYIKALDIKEYGPILDKHKQQAEEYVRSFPELGPQTEEFELTDGRTVILEGFVNKSSAKTKKAIHTSQELDSYYFRHIKKLKIHNMDYSPEAIAGVIKRTGSIKAPVIFVDGEPIYDEDKIYDFLTKQIVRNE